MSSHGGFRFLHMHFKRLGMHYIMVGLKMGNWVCNFRDLQPWQRRLLLILILQRQNWKKKYQRHQSELKLQFMAKITSRMRLPHKHWTRSWVDGGLDGQQDGGGCLAYKYLNLKQNCRRKRRYSCCLSVMKPRKKEKQSQADQGSVAPGAIRIN